MSTKRQHSDHIERIDAESIENAPLGLTCAHLYSTLKLRQDADGRLLIIALLIKVYEKMPAKDLVGYKLIVGNLLLPMAVDQNVCDGCVANTECCRWTSAAR